MNIHEAYKEQMAAQLREWTAQIKLLEAKAESAGADMKLKRAKALQELHAQQRAASEKMLELGKASGDAWEQLRNTADRMWADLKTGISDAQSKFK